MLSFNHAGDVTLVALVSRLSAPFLNLPEPVSQQAFTEEKPSEHSLGQKSKVTLHYKRMALLFFCSGNVSKSVPSTQFCGCN